MRWPNSRKSLIGLVPAEVPHSHPLDRRWPRRSPLPPTDFAYRLAASGILAFTWGFAPRLRSDALRWFAAVRMSQNSSPLSSTRSSWSFVMIVRKECAGGIVCGGKWG